MDFFFDKVQIKMNFFNTRGVDDWALLSNARIEYLDSLVFLKFLFYYFSKLVFGNYDRFINHYSELLTVFPSLETLARVCKCECAMLFF